MRKVGLIYDPIFLGTIHNVAAVIAVINVFGEYGVNIDETGSFKRQRPAHR